MHDATALATAIDQGRVTALEVMEATLSACDQQADLGAVVHLDAAMGRAGARAADAAPRAGRGPFHGVPFMAKDLGSMAAGLPLAAGAEAFRDGPTPASDSDLFAGFRRTGLVPFGVTASPPFGLSLSCEPDGLRPTRNPWNTDLTPGGSSGGAAASVAAGIVAIAHATDAAGSIRVPAACCGLTGLKPSRGTVSGGPDYSNHLMGLASELVLARSVRDVDMAFRAIAPCEGPQAAPARIGLAIPDRCAPVYAQAARDMAAALQDAGFEVQDMPAPDALGAEAHDIARIILTASLAEWLTACEVLDADVPPLAAAMAAMGRAMPATELFAASRRMAQVGAAAVQLFDEVEAIVMPVLSGPPPPVGHFDSTGKDPVTHMARLEAFAPNAALANTAGLPALALPFGMADGLPVGAQLIGPQSADLMLLGLGAIIEARAPALTFPYPIAGLPT